MYGPVLSRENRRSIPLRSNFDLRMLAVDRCDEPPSWVQIGPYEATKIGRQGNVVTVEIEIPSDATLGVFLDCHMEFASQQGRGIPTTLKRNDVMRVVE